MVKHEDDDDDDATDINVTTSNIPYSQIKAISTSKALYCVSL